MKLMKISQFTGQTHEREIPITEARYLAWENADPITRPLIQKAFPDLSEADREYILTGCTPEEWDAIMGSDVEDD